MKRNNLFLRMVFFCLVLGASMMLPSARAQLPWMENPLVGRKAPDFTLPTFDGKKVNLTEFRGGKSAIIFFWATWCPHCRDSLKELTRETESLTKKGIQLILVDIGEREREVRSYIDKNKITAMVLLDIEDALTEPYGIIGVPTFVFVDADGIIKSVGHSMPENYESLLSVRNAVEN